MGGSGDDRGVEAEQQAAQGADDDALHQIEVEFARPALRLRIRADVMHHSLHTTSSFPFGSAKWKRRPPGNSNISTTILPPASTTLRCVSSSTLAYKTDERDPLHRRDAHGEPTAQPPVTEAGVVGAAVGEAPTKHRVVETLRCFDVGGRRHDVVDLEVAVRLPNVAPRAEYQRARLAQRLSSAVGSAVGSRIPPAAQPAELHSGLRLPHNPPVEKDASPHHCRTQHRCAPSVRGPPSRAEQDLSCGGSW